jgi:hypothetical protein
MADKNRRLMASTPTNTEKKLRRARYYEVPVFTLTPFTNSLNLPDGDYSGRYEGMHAIIRFKDSQPVAIHFIGGVISTMQGLLKSSLQLLLPQPIHP